MRDFTKKKGSQFIACGVAEISVVEKQWTNGQLMARKNLKKECLENKQNKMPYRPGDERFV